MMGISDLRGGRGKAAWILFSLLFFVIQPASAQLANPAPATQKMSLQEVLALTEKANFEVRMAEADIDRARSQFRQTHAAFLPQLTIEETGISTNDPLSVFGFLLKQEIVTQADFNPATLNDPSDTHNFLTKFSVRQPVFNPDMLYRRSAAKNQLKAAREQMEGTLQYARFQVKDTYYQLQLMQERMDVIEKSLSMARENERQAKNFFEQDIISKADYLAARVRRLGLESRQSSVENQMQTVQDNLRYLLNMEEEITIVPADSMQMRPVSSGEIVARGQPNSQLQALKYRISAAEQMLNSARFSFVPSLNVFGSYEFNDDVLLGMRGESYMIGATLKWNLFSGYSKIGKISESQAQVKKAKLTYQSRVFKNRLDIQKAKRSVGQAESQLNFAEASVSQAAEYFRIRQNRYKQGLEKTTDLLEAEAKLAQARFKRLNAIYQYNLSVATLELLLEHEVGQ